MGLFFYLLTKLSKQYNTSLIFHKFIIFFSSIIIFSILYTIFLNKDDFDDNDYEVDDSTKVDKQIYFGVKKRVHLSFLNKYFEMLYFSAITQSTVGFGDISPKTPLARILVVIQILTSFILLSL